MLIGEMKVILMIFKRIKPREERLPIPNTYEVRITGFLTIETQGDGQFEDSSSSFNFETEPLIFPSNMVYTDISTNVLRNTNI